MAAVVAGSALSSSPPLAHAAQHIVAPGETLTAIASRYGLPVETLMDVNGIADPNAIHEGDVLIIPEFAESTPVPDAGRFHTVVPGDTLSGLADLYGVSVDDIAAANGIFDPTGVHLGATLIIPGSMAPSPADAGVVAPAPAAAASGIRHTVEAGEILSAIADTYGVRLEALVAANGLANPNAIFPGQVLVVPGANREGPALVETSAVVHVVLPGDTLSSIADRYGVDLSRLAEPIVRELRNAEPERHVDFAAAPGLIARGDERLLRVVLHNLLSNAWKFSARQAAPSVELGQIRGDAGNAFFVRDNGAGFDMKYADKLFGAFQRLHGVKEFDGTGIGLATVLRIVQRHGGRAWAEGAVGTGATVFFTLG